MNEERVLGGLEVETMLEAGSEHLFLFFTQTRMIMAHMAKVGSGSTALSRILGRFSGGLRKGAPKGELLEKMAGLTPESLLDLDKENFAVAYDQVVSLTVKPGIAGRADVTLVTRDMKVDMSASMTAIQGVREMLEPGLGNKVSIRL